MKIHYKILHGFSPEDYIEIEENEVQKAFGAFLQKKDAVFTGGAIRGNLIQAIKPDFHKTMGWNRGYKLDNFDYEELSQKGIDKKANDYLSACKDVVQGLIESKQEHLIGKYEINVKEVKVGDRGGMKSIGEII